MLQLSPQWWLMLISQYVIVGPSKAEVSCKDNHDGTCTVEYLPTKAGDYDIAVKFADQNIPGRGLSV